MKIIDQLRGNWVLATEISKLEARLWSLTRRENHKVVLVTSAVRGEGKSTTVAYLSTSLGLYPNRRILAVDFDFRVPQLGQYFEKRGRVSLDKVLDGSAKIEDAIISTSMPGLDLMLPGRAGADPNLLLETDRLHALFETVRERYDLVLVDSPALIPVADTTMLMPHADSLLIVGMAGKTTQAQLRRVQEIAEGMQSQILGLVIGNLQQAAPEYMVDDYGYYGGYGSPKAKRDEKPPQAEPNKDQ